MTPQQQKRIDTIQNVADARGLFCASKVCLKDVE